MLTKSEKLYITYVCLCVFGYMCALVFALWALVYYLQRDAVLNLLVLGVLALQVVSVLGTTFIVGDAVLTSKDYTTENILDGIMISTLLTGAVYFLSSVVIIIVKKESITLGGYILKCAKLAEDARVYNDTRLYIANLKERYDQVTAFDELFKVSQSDYFILCGGEFIVDPLKKALSMYTEEEKQDNLKMKELMSNFTCLLQKVSTAVNNKYAESAEEYNKAALIFETTRKDILKDMIEHIEQAHSTYESLID